MFVINGEIILIVAVICLVFLTVIPLAVNAQINGASSYSPQWKLVWSDEFNGPAGSPVDSAKWEYDLGGWGWGNEEAEYYTNRTKNVYQENGFLVIQALRENYESWEYTSGRIKTKGKFEPLYGRIEARIKLPFGQGIWPAFWMLGNDIDTNNWPNCGEIDIMENLGREPYIIHGTIHGPGYSGAGGPTNLFQSENKKISDDFHVYAIEWEPNRIRWYFDDQCYYTISPDDILDKWVFEHPFFILLNVAVGGSWPGYPDGTTVFPQKMLIDYVRVYQKQ